MKEIIKIKYNQRWERLWLRPQREPQGYTGKEGAAEDTGKESQPSFLHCLLKFMDMGGHHATQKATVTSSVCVQNVSSGREAEAYHQSPTQPLSSSGFWLLLGPLTGCWDVPWCPSISHLKSHMGSTSCKERPYESPPLS